MITHSILKSYKNSNEYVLIHDISYKIILSAKPLHIRFDKIDGFIKAYDGTWYLVLFGPKRYDAIYDIIGDLIIDKSSISFSISHPFWKISTDSCNSLSIEKHLLFIKCTAINTIHNFLKEMFLYWKCYIPIELTFPKKLMLIREANQKITIFITTGIF